MSTGRKNMSSITINAGWINSDTQAAGDSKAQIGGVKLPKSISAAGMNIQNDPIEERKKQGQKMAWKVVSDAWKSDQSVEQSIEGRREHYSQMSALRDAATEELKTISESEKSLQQEYNVSDDSKEQQDLELLKKEQDVKNGVSSAGLTKDEMDKLAQIHSEPLTEYQERALDLNDRAAVQKINIRDANAAMRDDVSDVAAIKQERLKSHGMVDAQNSAEEIMAAVNDDIISMSMQDAMENIDEQMEVVQEKAKENADEKEEKEEQIEEHRLEQKVKEAIAEGSKEAVEEAKAEERRNDSQDMELGDMMQMTGNDADVTVSRTTDSLTEIKSNMKLLEADLKGIKVDEQA
jgi:hypothetical protein